MILHGRGRSFSSPSCAPVRRSLFHEPGVRVFRGAPVRAECSCSRESVEAMLKSFSQDDRDHMVENGRISVTCEFCSANYLFAPGDVGAKPS